jgi:hypothetical protein
MVVFIANMLTFHNLNSLGEHSQIMNRFEGGVLKFVTETYTVQGICRVF